MPFLKYPYFTFPGSARPRPVAPVVAFNTLNGKSAEFVGILDSGADSTTLTVDIARILGINLSTLPSEQVGGVHGIDDARFCDFLKISLLHPSSRQTYSPNRDSEIPIFIPRGARFCLLGQRNFLEHCVSIFDGPKNIVSLDF